MDMKYTFTQSEGHTETWEYTMPVNGAELVSKAVSGVNVCDRCSGVTESVTDTILANTTYGYVYRK